MTNVLPLLALVLGVVHGSSDDTKDCMTVSADEAAYIASMREEALESGDKDHLKMLQVNGQAITTLKNVADVASVSESDEAVPLGAVQEDAQNKADSKWYGGRTTIYHHHGGYRGYGRYRGYRRYRRYGGYRRYRPYRRYGRYGGGTTIIHHHHGGGWLQAANEESPGTEQGPEDMLDAEEQEADGNAEGLAATQENADDGDASDWGAFHYNPRGPRGGWGHGYTYMHHNPRGPRGGWGHGTTMVHHHGYGWLQAANKESPGTEEGREDMPDAEEQEADGEGEGFAAIQENADDGDASDWGAFHYNPRGPRGGWGHGYTYMHHNPRGPRGGWGHGTTIVHHHGYGWLQAANKESPGTEEGQEDMPDAEEQEADGEGEGLAADQENADDGDASD